MKKILTIILTILLTACGGSSSGSGMLIEGQLTQGGETGHENSAQLRHSAGEQIAEVAICALGECSVTDAEGQWGIIAPEEFNGGDVLFDINGHGIDTQTALTIPADVTHVVVELIREGDVVDAEIADAHGDHAH